MMTRKLKISAARQGANGIEHVTLGTGVEWDGKNITLELHAIPVGNWWSGVVTVLEAGAAPRDHSPMIRQRFDVVAAKRRAGSDKVAWIKVGTAYDIANGTITADFENIPAGSWWDGKLRLFEQRKNAKHGKD